MSRVIRMASVPSPAPPDDPASRPEAADPPHDGPPPPGAAATSASWGAATTLLAAAVLLAATAFLFSPLLAGVLRGGPRWFEWDVPEQYWPDQVFLCRSLHEGSLPLWNPWDRAGYPYYADPQAATWHPWSWLVCGLGGASPGPAWSGARVVLGFALCGFFGSMWLRRMGFAPGPALLGAVVMLGAPFMRHNWELNLTFGLAFLPLMLWAAEGLVARRRPVDAALLALSVALCGWSGSPPALWMASTFCALWLGFRAVQRIGEEGRGALRPLARALALAALLAFALLAVVLVPAAGLARLSVQAGNDLGSIADGALGPSDLPALIWPHPGNHLYVGAIPLLLAGLALAQRRRGRDATAAWFLAAVAALAVLMALGRSTPLFPLAFRLVPGVDLFRLPHRYEAWLGPAAGALCAIGLTRLGRRWRPAASVGVAALLVAVQVADVSRELPPDRHTRGGPHPGLSMSALDLAPEAGLSSRYVDEFGVSCRSGTRLARRELRGYQDPLQLAAWARVIASLREAPRLAEQLSVRHAITGPHYIHGWDRHFLPPPAELLAIPGARDLGEGVIELPSPLPSAWWVPAEEVDLAAHRQEALARVARAAPAMLAVLERDAQPREAGAAAAPGLLASLPGGRRGEAHARSRSVRSFDVRPDRVEMLLDAPSAGVVVVNEAWYPGWTATVDGMPAPVVRANALVRAVPVPARAERLVLLFEPRDGVPLRWLLLAGLAGCAATPFVRRRPASPTSPGPAAAVAAGSRAEVPR